MKQKDLLFILISSMLVVVAWIIFNVAHSSLSSTITENTAQNIVPINGNFDTKTLHTLKNRANVIPQNSIGLSPTPTPTPTVAPITPVSPLQSLSVKSASGGGTTQ